MDYFSFIKFKSLDIYNIFLIQRGVEILEIEQQLIKRAIKFLGLIFMMCGGIIIIFNIIFLPGRTILLPDFLPDFIFWILIFSVGYALDMVSRAL